MFSFARIGPVFSARPPYACFLGGRLLRSRPSALKTPHPLTGGKSAESLDLGLLGIGIDGFGGAASAPTGGGFEGATRRAAQGLSSVAGMVWGRRAELRCRTQRGVHRCDQLSRLLGLDGQFVHLRP